MIRVSGFSYRDREGYGRGVSEGRQFSIEEQLIGRNVERFQGGLVLKAHRWLYHSTLSSRVIKKKKKKKKAARSAMPDSAQISYEKKIKLKPFWQ